MKSVESAANAELVAHAAAGWLGPARTFLLFALVFGLLASISVTQISLGALAVWVVLARWAGVIPALRAPLLGPIVAFVVWTVVAALASERPLDSLLTARNALNLAALFVVVNVLSEPALVRRFATWLLAGLGLLALVALVQVAACPGPEATGLLRKCTRARGFYSIYMTLGGVLAVLLTSALPRLLRLQREAGWLAPAWLLGLGALALTYVRGAWIGFAAGALAALAGLGRRGLVGLLALVVLGAVLLLGLPGVRDRLGTIGTMGDDTTRDRVAMLEAGQRLVKEHPLTGIGPGQIKHVYPKVATPEAMRRSTSHLHNSPMQIAAERGVPGLAAWLWIFVAFLLRGAAALRALPADAAGDRALALGTLAAVIAFLVAGLFEYNFGDTEVLLLTLTLMAWPFALSRRDRV
jgi:O-antigen ligase